MTTDQQQYVDPFAGAEKNPSISFKDAKPGTSYTGIVRSVPKEVQSRDYKTGDPATWPDGNKKMSVVIEVEINGETRSLWAPRPSAMFAACAEAQKKAGAPISPGGTITVVFTHEIPNDDPKMNAAKQYTVTYVPPNAFADEPPF